MFFDEYNNFVVMSKEYLLPEEGDREVDSILLGQEKDELLPNILNISSEEKRIYNEGSINYTTRYLQRSISQYRQAPFTDRFKTYGYKPSLLWEVAGKDKLRSQNEAPEQSEGFVLSAAPLNSDLDDNIPFVENGNIVNNIIDLGENIDNVSSYNGYFYANGEIIQYDAMEYAVTGSFEDGENIVWIKNNQEYQRYFSKLPFNGKMYPTGNLRIFVEPEYASDEDTLIIIGIKKHGRGQFGTPVSYHSAGLDPYWSDNAVVKGCVQSTEEYLFSASERIEYPEDLTQLSAGKFDSRLPATSNPKNADLFSQNSSRNGIIKNFRANKYYTENEVDYFSTARVGTLQSSALVFRGPEIPADLGMRTADFVSYVYKELPEPYKHFGTRVRIIGKIESTNEKSQTPLGAFPIFETVQLNVEEPEKNIQVFGGAGGLAFSLNKETNVGYYFEIVSLTQDNVQNYGNANTPKPITFKIINEPKPSCSNNVVTVSTEKPIEFEVGQKVVISGLADENNTENRLTPLNGEYQITAIDNNKKRFEYVIPSPSVPVLNISAVEGNGTFIKYIVPTGDTRKTYIKGGDKINISGLSDPSFNIQNAIVRSFIKTQNEWYFTVESEIQGSLTSQNGTATYIPLTTTSRSGGTVSISAIGNNNLANIYFYKVLADKDGKAIPYKLWSGIGDILVDDGKFTGQYRFLGEENPTVYDLAAESINVGTAKRFFLYINGKQVATVTDEEPLPEYNNMALFVRGSSRCMFENIYALGVNVSQNSKVSLNTPVSKVFGDEEIDANEALRKYAISGAIQKTYLSGIGSEEPPSHLLYFDEFGTIMREAAYLDIKYDRAFPALYARVMKTFNRLKGYSISGFYAGSYKADFLVFNCTDTNLNLDDTTGNYLRIQGITFTQSTTKVLTVDEFYKKRSNLSDPINSFDGTIINPFLEKEEFNRILNSRSKYGTNEFTIESMYIQSDEAAENVFGWTIQKISKPKILVGMNTFATFNLQLGDLLEINYKNNDGLDIISETNKKFVVYNMEYTKELDAQNLVMYLAEV
jgi:hypothetical protein